MTKEDQLYYGKYLQLDQLLSSQSPKSRELGREAHDEMLFIIVHQAYELWFKEILHDLDSVLHLFAQENVDEKKVGVAVARLRRITEIQQLLISQLRVLETMTPLDFLEFRDLLIPASGFQSMQFRCLESKLGLRREHRVGVSPGNYLSHFSAGDREVLVRVEEESSLFELVEKWLERTPFLQFGSFNFWDHYTRAVRLMLTSDRKKIEDNPLLEELEKKRQLQEWTRTEQSFEALLDEERHGELLERGERRLSYRATQAALLIHLYRDEPILQQPFRFLDLLVDVDELLAAWRYRHALMVHRMIGTKIGTGGSAGHHYLRTTADRYKVFLDLAELPTFLLPRSSIPELPAEVRKQLDFSYKHGN